MTISEPSYVQRQNSNARAPRSPAHHKIQVPLPRDILREQPSIDRQNCFHSTFPTQQCQASNPTTSQNQCLDRLHARSGLRRLIQALCGSAREHAAGYLLLFPLASLAIIILRVFRGDGKSPRSKLDKQTEIELDAT